MKVQRPWFGEPLFVLPDEGRTPLAGPFTTPAAARLWIVEKIEASLKGEKAETWAKLAARLPAPGDMGLELALIGFVAKGIAFEQLLKYVPRGPDRRHAADRRMLASGEAA